MIPALLFHLPPILLLALALIQQGRELARLNRIKL